MITKQREDKRDFKTLMLIDGEPARQRFITTIASREGWRTHRETDTDTALRTLGGTASLNLSAIIVDESACRSSIGQFIAQLQRERPTLPVIAITSRDNLATAIEAMKSGASDFVHKPLSANHLLRAVKRIENMRTGKNSKDELHPLTEKFPYAIKAFSSFEALVGSSSAFCRALTTAAQAAHSRQSVMITGKSGAGKEIFARTIHAASPRTKGPLILIDCAAIEQTLIASQLFGHERGAFPGAFDRQISQLIQADGGTIIIEKIEYLPLKAQAQLLEFLRSDEVQTIGGTIKHRVDTRIIATCDPLIEKRLADGDFRKDLYETLATTQVVLPSLSERRGDIAPLTKHLLRHIGKLPGMRAMTITDDALQLLTACSWPGNVRELHDAVFRAATACKVDTLTCANFSSISSALKQKTSNANDNASQNITVSDKVLDIALYTQDGNLRLLEDIEADVIRLAIGHYRGHMSEVARRLGIGRSTLYRKLSDIRMESVA